jgi:putative spermidine/putrescine transport system ATP-binding protein
LTYSETATPMVRLVDIDKSYGAVQALAPTSLEVAKGEFLTLLGPSGSGKSTILNVIAGMVSPSNGSVWIDGEDVTSVQPSKRGIGMVFQNYALMPHMTIFENIAFPLRIRKVPKAEVRERVLRVLETVHLPNVANRKPKELSGGQQQRVSIARCLVYNPALILMDEPLGALDKGLREHMQLEIRRLHRELGVTMIYVTHDQEEALNMSDRIMLMNGGRVEQIATPLDIYRSPVTRFAAESIGNSVFLSARHDGQGAASLEDGSIVNVRHGAAKGTGHVMVRPESMRMLHDRSLALGENVVAGELQDTLVTGAIIKHFVRLPNGTLMTVQELANERRTILARGADVFVAWPVDAGTFLDR